MEVTHGTVKRAQKVVIYGAEGIGKTTLASRFPAPLFLDMENGSAHLDVFRYAPRDWADLLAAVKDCADLTYRTVVIDTVDAAEKACIRYICDRDGKKGVEDYGYGKGYTYLQEEFSALLKRCDVLIKSGVNVVLIGHAQMRKFEQPDEMGSYDRWELKLTKKICPDVKEWADMVLFCNYKTFTVTDENGKVKAQGGKRTMYTQHHPCWDAKNRHGLPGEIEMDFACLEYIFDDIIQPKKVKEIMDDKPKDITPLVKLRNLMIGAGITDEQIQNLVASKGYYSADTPIDSYSVKFINGWCIKHFKQIEEMIKEDNSNE